MPRRPDVPCPSLRHRARMPCWSQEHKRVAGARRPDGNLIRDQTTFDVSGNLAVASGVAARANADLRALRFRREGREDPEEKKRKLIHRFKKEEGLKIWNDTKLANEIEVASKKTLGEIAHVIQKKKRRRGGTSTADGEAELEINLTELDLDDKLEIMRILQQRKREAALQNAPTEASRMRKVSDAKQKTEERIAQLQQHLASLRR